VIENAILQKDKVQMKNKKTDERKLQ